VEESLHRHGSRIEPQPKRNRVKTKSTCDTARLLIEANIGIGWQELSYGRYERLPAGDEYDSLGAEFAGADSCR